MVHELPSLQAMVSFAATGSQRPAALHTPLLHASVAEAQATPGVGTGLQVPLLSQMPVLHSSVASTHTPFGGMASEKQTPSTGLQTPLLQPFVNAEQSFGTPPPHTPPL